MSVEDRINEEINMWGWPPNIDSFVEYFNEILEEVEEDLQKDERYRITIEKFEGEIEHEVLEETSHLISIEMIDEDDMKLVHVVPVFGDSELEVFIMRNILLAELVLRGYKISTNQELPVDEENSEEELDPTPRDTPHDVGKFENDFENIMRLALKAFLKFGTSPKYWIGIIRMGYHKYMDIRRCQLEAIIPGKNRNRRVWKKKVKCHTYHGMIMRDMVIRELITRGFQFMTYDEIKEYP